MSKITILKGMECTFQHLYSIVTGGLYIYFPDQSFISFIKAVDSKVRSIANSDGIKKHGKSIIAVASEGVKQDKSLLEQFKKLLGDCLDDMKEIVMSFLILNLLEKLYNTSLVEFADCYRQTQAAEKGSATLSGQNLRDSLLSQHTNLKSTDTRQDIIIANPSY